MSVRSRVHADAMAGMPSEACDISVLLIAKKMAGNFGLAPRKWLAQLQEIRALPERCGGGS